MDKMLLVIHSGYTHRLLQREVNFHDLLSKLRENAGLDLLAVRSSPSGTPFRKRGSSGYIKVGLPDKSGYLDYARMYIRTPNNSTREREEAVVEAVDGVRGEIALGLLDGLVENGFLANDRGVLMFETFASSRTPSQINDRIREMLKQIGSPYDGKQSESEMKALVRAFRAAHPDLDHVEEKIIRQALTHITPPFEHCSCFTEATMGPARVLDRNVLSRVFGDNVPYAHVVVVTFDTESG